MIFTALLAVAFLAVRLWRLTAGALNGDEVFTCNVVFGSWNHLFTTAIYDAVHPPLFYILLKLWIALGGDSLFWIRLLPVLMSFLCIFPFIWLCRDLEVSAATRNLTIALVALNPYAIFYSQFVRMYGQFMLFGLLSTWLFQRYTRRRDPASLVFLTLVNTCLVYTQYYGWMIVGIESVYLLWQRRDVRWFSVSVAATAVLFSPWAWMVGQVLGQRGLGQNLSWIQRPKLHDVLKFIWSIMGLADSDLRSRFLAVAVALFLFALYWTFRESRLRWIWFLTVSTVPVAFCAAYALSQSTWSPRYLGFMLWPLMLLVAETVVQSRGVVRCGLWGVVAVWGVWAAMGVLRDNRKLGTDALLLTMLSEEQGHWGPVKLYTVGEQYDLETPLPFYLDCLKTHRFGPFGPRLNDVARSTRSEDITIVKAKTLREVDGSHFWIAYMNRAWQGPQPRAVLSGLGCHVGPDHAERSRFYIATLLKVDCPVANAPLPRSP